MLLFYPFIYGKMIVWKMMMSTLFKLTTLAVATTSALFSGAVFAQETAKIYTLDPIVITASKTEQNVSQVPARIHVIEQATIAQNPALNLSDVLQNDASVYVKQNGGIGQGTNLSLRGAYPKHTLILKDGLKLNTPNTLTPTYPETLDLTSADRVEVLKGPASVQYGSDAIGGVINVISQTPQKTGGFITGIYGENNTYKAIIGADLAQNGFYAQLRGQRMETDGTRIFNTQPKSLKASYDQKGYHAKVGYDNQQNINAAVEINQNEGVNIYSDNSGVSNTAQRQFENRTILAKIAGKPHQDFTLSAHYGQAEDKQKYRETWSTNRFNTKHQEFDLNARWQFTPAQNILIGATTGQDEYEDAYAYIGKKDVKSTGYYLQHQYHNDHINTQIGMRVEDHHTFGTHTVGQGAIRYHFTPNTSLYANIGSAFKAPSLNELYYNSTSTWGTTTYQTLGNLHLKPEESLSYELGLDHHLAKSLQVGLSMYKTEIKNLIATNSTFANNINTSTYENIDKAQFTGGELGVKWNQNNLFASAQYAYVKTKNKATALEIAYRPKHTGTVVLGYDDGQYGVNTAITARSDAKVANSANAGKLAGYATIDVNTHWQINPNIKLFANVQNIGDVQYPVVWNFGNWYVHGGRQANLGLTIKY